MSERGPCPPGTHSKLGRPTSHGHPSYDGAGSKMGGGGAEGGGWRKWSPLPRSPQPLRSRHSPGRGHYLPVPQEETPGPSLTLHAPAPALSSAVFLLSQRFSNPGLYRQVLWSLSGLYETLECLCFHFGIIFKKININIF